LGMRIHGVPILGNVHGLSRLVKKHEIDEILIAISSATGKEMRRIVERCKATGIRFKTIPGIGELIDGRVSIKTIRDVSYEDLMGRKTVRMELDKIGNYATGEAVLITGAGGSIGSELCRQIARFDPSPLILLDCAENNLFQVEMEFARDYPQFEYIPILGNILNSTLLDNIFQAYHPRVVFHAAAYKHVPMMELNPWEAVHNNIQGTQSILEAVQRYGVERFVFVSTDKAVRPANVMGASKRVGELLTQACSKDNHGRFMSVRFGNVIGSSGSVIPLFQEQIKKGGPLTLTHPEVTRFFMTIPEAAQLILQAGAMGEGGEIFILDMGSPIKIVDLANDLIRLSGFEPGRGIEIQFTGLRPGEKLYEELITEGEGIVKTHHEKILVLRGNSIQQDALLSKISELYHLAAKQDAPRIKEKLKEIVPEYQISPENSHLSPENVQASQSETSHVFPRSPKGKGDKGTNYRDFVSP
jgi:FlaA1/EpsC-like NDP-sugar epimerase